MVFPRLPLLSEEVEPDPWVGGAMFTLLDDPDDWVHRRVESASFIDAVSIRRRVSVDFDVPDFQDTPAEGFNLIPIAVLEKQPLVDLDVTDEAGTTLPVLNADENGFVAWSVLARVAKQALVPNDPQDVLLHDVLKELKVIGAGTPKEAAAKLSDLQKASDPTLKHALNLAVFDEYARLLAARFLLLVELPLDQRQHRVLKFSYTAEFTPVTGRSVVRFFERVGWRATRASVDVPGLGEGQSFHFEFEGPPGLQVTKAELFCANPHDDGDNGRTHQGQVLGSRAHIYSSNETYDVDGQASVWLRPGRPGLLRASFITAAVIASLFAFFLWDERILQVRHGLALPLLMAAPGLVASFIVRPGEHGMTTDLFVGIRILIGVCALCAYIGAIALAGEVSESTLGDLWSVLGIVTGLCHSGLGISYLAARPTTREEDGANG